MVIILLGENIYFDPLFNEIQAKMPLFSLNVSFRRMQPLKLNDDVICRFMTSQYATSRKCVLHGNGSLMVLIRTFFVGF